MTPAERFERTLEHLFQDTSDGMQLLYLHMAFLQILKTDKRFLAVANRTPVFWNATLLGWQHGYMIALGRAYDCTTQHNVQALLNQFEISLSIFSKTALAKRKRAASANADNWLPKYLESAHVPTATDVKRLKATAQAYQNLYKTKYAPLRSKVFAHNVTNTRLEASKLFSVARFPELQKLFVFLLKLHRALHGLYQNGHRPILKPVKYSLPALIRKAKMRPRTGGPQETMEVVVAELKAVSELLKIGVAQT